MEWKPVYGTTYGCSWVHVSFLQCDELKRKHLEAGWPVSDQETDENTRPHLERDETARDLIWDDVVRRYWLMMCELYDDVRDRASIVIMTNIETSRQEVFDIPAALSRDQTQSQR